MYRMNGASDDSVLVVLVHAETEEAYSFFREESGFPILLIKSHHTASGQHLNNRDGDRRADQ